MDLNYHHALVHQRGLLAAAARRPARAGARLPLTTVLLARLRRAAAPAARPAPCPTC